MIWDSRVRRRKPYPAIHRTASLSRIDLIEFFDWIARLLFPKLETEAIPKLASQFSHVPLNLLTP